MWSVEYDNAVGPEDSWFKEWWSVSYNGVKFCDAVSEEDAERLVRELMRSGFVPSGKSGPKEER